jgi:hypothetical protein
MIQKADAKVNAYKDAILKVVSEDSILTRFMETIDSIPLPNFDDMLKRRRSKNSVPVNELCIARRANGERCTRHKKGTNDCCGTHCKGAPHGVISNIEQSIPHTKLEVWTEDFNGIVYYIDANHNVYKTEDVLRNKPNPSVYAKWQKINEIYSIV